MSGIRRLLLLTVLSALVLPATSAEAPRGMNPKLSPVPACLALAAAAQTKHIPMDQFDSASGTNLLHPGDSATVVITFVQKEKRLQWLLYFEAAPPDPKKPPAGKKATFVVNSGFGPPMKFESTPVAAKLRLLGPFAVNNASKPPKAEETDAQFFLNQDFLGLGLDQPAALMARWSQTTNFDGAVTSKAIKAMKPTPAEQRAICATFPALFSYADIVQHTEGLDELFFKLVELPSVWSFVRNLGMKVDFSFGNGQPAGPANPADWNLPDSAPVYYFPWLLRLNEQPAMKVTLVVTSPRPPRLICGGVVALLAEKAGSDDTYMTMELVSAKCGTSVN
jgi:hypothetical protein